MQPFKVYRSASFRKLFRFLRRLLYHCTLFLPIHIYHLPSAIYHLLQRLLQIFVLLLNCLNQLIIMSKLNLINHRFLPSETRFHYCLLDLHLTLDHFWVIKLQLIVSPLDNGQLFVQSLDLVVCLDFF